MKRRSMFKQLFVLAAFATLPIAAFAQGNPVDGKQFSSINPALPTDSGDKVEVIEFFSYGCPHCYEFEPKVGPWAKALPKDVVFKRVPISFNREAWAVLGKIYLTLDILGQAERMNPLVFSAVQNERLNFGDEAARNAWLQKNGIDAAKFNDTFKSFSVQSRMQRSTQIAAAYQVQGVPSIAIDGKFMTSPAMNGTFESTLNTMDALVARARAARGRK